MRSSRLTAPKVVSFPAMSFPAMSFPAMSIQLDGTEIALLAKLGQPAVVFGLADAFWSRSLHCSSVLADSLSIFRTSLGVTKQFLHSRGVVARQRVTAIIHVRIIDKTGSGQSIP
jgi:hypothetical protein